MIGESLIASARDAYLRGALDVEALESAVWDALTCPHGSPLTSRLSLVLKAWTDAPGEVLSYEGGAGCKHVWRVGDVGCILCGEPHVIRQYGCCDRRWGQAHPGPVKCSSCGGLVLPIQTIVV